MTKKMTGAIRSAAQLVNHNKKTLDYHLCRGQWQCILMQLQRNVINNKFITPEFEVYVWEEKLILIQQLFVHREHQVRCIEQKRTKEIIVAYHGIPDGKQYAK